MICSPLCVLSSIAHLKSRTLFKRMTRFDDVPSVSPECGRFLLKARFCKFTEYFKQNDVGFQIISHDLVLESSHTKQVAPLVTIIALVFPLVKHPIFK